MARTASYFAQAMQSKRYRSFSNVRNFASMFRMKRLFYLSVIVCSAALHTSAAQAQWVQTNGPYGVGKLHYPHWQHHIHWDLWWCIRIDGRRFKLESQNIRVARESLCFGLESSGYKLICWINVVQNVLFHRMAVLHGLIFTWFSITIWVSPLVH